MKRLISTVRQLDQTTRIRLLVLVVLNAGATLIAVAASGAADFGVFDTCVALLCAATGAASLRTVRTLLEPRPTDVSKAQSSAARSRTRVKAFLALAMIAGAFGYIGGHGTLAIFTAEDTNSNTQITSGTLVIGDTVNTGSTCYSYSGTTLDNVNTGCTALVSPPNMAPGSTVAQSKLVVENDGSLDAGTFYLYAPWPRSTLSTPLTSGAAPTGNQLVLSTGLGIALSSGDQLTLSYQGHSQTYTVAAAGAAAGATTIPLSSPAAANFSYPAGTRVEDVSGDTTATNMDCYDKTTTNPSWPASGSTPGSVLPFVTATGNPLCSAVLFWVQEQTNGVNYCWVGRGATGSAAPATNGQCRTPTTMTLSSALGTASATTSLPVQALTGNVASGDTITLTETGHTDTFTVAASSDRYIGATSIPVTSHTANFAYDSGATVVDTTAFNDLDGDAVDTIKSFDTSHRPNSPVQLYPLTSNTTPPNSLATVSLGKQGSSGSAGYQRTFYVGVFLPAPSSSAQNQLQGLISTFGLSWHIEQ